MLPNISSRQKTTPCSHSSQTGKSDRFYYYAKLLAEENNSLQPISSLSIVTQPTETIRQSRKSQPVAEQTGLNDPHLFRYYNRLSKQYIPSTSDKIEQPPARVQSLPTKNRVLLKHKNHKVAYDPLKRTVLTNSRLPARQSLELVNQTINNQSSLLLRTGFDKHEHGSRCLIANNDKNYVTLSGFKYKAITHQEPAKKTVDSQPVDIPEISLIPRNTKTEPILTNTAKVTFSLKVQYHQFNQERMDFYDDKEKTEHLESLRQMMLTRPYIGFTHNSPVRNRLK